MHLMAVLLIASRAAKWLLSTRGPYSIECWCKVLVPPRAADGMH